MGGEPRISACSAAPAVTPSGGNGHGGSAQAAAYWYLDAKRVDPSAGQTLVAGGFNFNTLELSSPRTCYYLGGYFRELSRIDPTPPDAIALHPYLDVDYAALNGGDPLPPATSGLPSAQGAIEVIDQVYPSDPQIWLTEAGVWLTNSGKAGVTSVCGDGNPGGRRHLAGVPQRQPDRAGARGRGVPAAPERVSQIARVYYYDFNNQNIGWDSGLVNLNAPVLGSSGYGAPRTAWCVLHNFAQGESPVTAEMNAARPGSPCDDQNPGDATYAPVVAQHFVAAPATARRPPPSRRARRGGVRARGGGGRADAARHARAGTTG